MNGTIKFFNGDKGYGFIKRDDGLADVFSTSAAWSIDMRRSRKAIAYPSNSASIAAGRALRASRSSANALRPPAPRAFASLSVIVDNARKFARDENGGPHLSVVGKRDFVDRGLCPQDRQIGNAV
jgi:hypothetical protein